MRKLIAILNVLAWSGFWAFGYLAIASPDFTRRQIVVAALLAGLGFLTGSWAWLRLVREERK